MLLPAVVLGGVDALAAAEVRDRDVGPQARRHDAQLVRRAPLPPLAVVAHHTSSRFGDSILPAREEAAANLAPVPLPLKHYITAVVEQRTTLRVCSYIVSICFPLLVGLTSFVVARTYDLSAKLDRVSDRLDRIERSLGRRVAPGAGPVRVG